MTVFIIVCGFLFSTVAAYMTGMVGSSNNPVSGMTLATIVVSSFALLACIRGTGAVDKDDGMLCAILIGSFVCCAAAAGGDMMQDLKTTQIIGATPLKIQLVRLIGFIVPSLFIGPIVYLLTSVYGIGTPTAAHPSPLLAPQATLMASVTTRIFEGQLPLDFVGIGMLLAVGVVILDFILQKCRSQFRVPVLAAALGLYLPFELTAAALLGGVVVSVARYTLMRVGASGRTVETNERNGLLFAAGLITGEALVGIMVAIPIFLSTHTTNPLVFFGDYSHVMWPGFVLLCVVMASLYAIVVGKAYNDSRYSFYGRL